MQFTSVLLALAATASATPIMGNIKMFYDANADCNGVPLQTEGGQSLAIPPDYINQCQLIPIGVANTTYKRFSASGLTPIFNFELYTDRECQQLATNASNVCVSDIKSYIPRRNDGN
ncbi:hypothetical protein GCG54_00015059 [Colletotrichum gloeosporioides]|uniref:Uncharacterized protein n=1 Tax=Colletotrichum gloeosporioides TaxID=474922 RepID=A0A8H4CDG1_COLGL|nr:uncharacterized protein GCG54_00015059 [Colletotrichum gloeosporioides]KAF3801839.1 hypothetical protein GCG54_00015059 [Colletotrichum gloeosporioides]